MSFRVEPGTVGDGSKRFFFFVKCPKCGQEVWINTVTRDPRERTYFCVACNTIVPQGTIDKIIQYLEKNKVN